MGLVCWRYTLEGRLPPLESNLGPDSFDLFMCEEDGTVDRDFPCLDWRESFSKYGFQQLALVPRKEEVIGQHRVTLHLPDGSFTELSVERTLTLGELLEQGLQKRRRTLPSLGHSQVGAFRFSYANLRLNFMTIMGQVPLRYHLEAAESSGVALDPTTNLSSHLGSEFYIVRSNSKRPSGPRDTSGGEHLNIYEVHLFQSFDVQMITKVRTKVDIHLGISGEKVEIDPKPQASSNLKILIIMPGLPTSLWKQYSTGIFKKASSIMYCRQVGLCTSRRLPHTTWTKWSAARWSAGGWKDKNPPK